MFLADWNRVRTFALVDFWQNSHNFVKNYFKGFSKILYSKNQSLHLTKYNIFNELISLGKSLNFLVHCREMINQAKYNKYNWKI